MERTSTADTGVFRGLLDYLERRNARWSMHFTCDIVVLVTIYSACFLALRFWKSGGSSFTQRLEIQELA